MKRKYTQLTSYIERYFFCYRIKLNIDQEEILEFSVEGHNLFITGQGGVGKSEVVKQIIRFFKARGKTVGVICASGIACQVYDRGLASTVHSFYGLSTAELPWRQLIDRSVGNSLIRDRVRALDVIIWDEASMSSRRMFELVNFLHHELATSELSKSLPFAGKQIILVGDSCNCNRFQTSSMKETSCSILPCSTSAYLIVLA